MIKYTLPYRAYDDEAWRVDISNSAYIYAPITLTGVEGSACQITWDPETADDPYAWKLGSSAVLSVYNQANIDIPELQNAQDRDFIVRVYRNADYNPNLFVITDPDVAIHFFVVYSTGLLQSNSTYNATGYIPVVAGKEYRLSYKNQIAWYDAAKVYISGSSSTDTNILQTAPIGAAYLRCSVVLAEWSAFSVTLTVPGDLYWTGYLIPDGIQKPMKSVPDIQLSCTDGLSLLTNMPFNYADNLPGTTSTPTRCPMNFIRLILFNTHNLGLPLPLHWTNSLQCTAFNDEMFTASVNWGLLGEGWTSYQSDDPTNPASGVVYKTCEYILAGIVKSIQGRIYQCDGKWIIRRVNDIVTGIIVDNSIAGDQGIMTVVTNTIGEDQVIGLLGYPFINENQLTTVRKGVQSCRVKYDANFRENILPNGSQDLVNTFATAPFYWAIDTDGVAESVAPIDGRSGAATKLTNPGGGGGAIHDFRPVDASGTPRYLPLDAYNLVKRIQFGFVFSPTAFGFPIGGGGFIDFSGNPFKINITYIAGTTLYYLDEFAIWRLSPIDIPIRPDGNISPGDAIQIDFNKNNAIILPKPPADLVPPTDTCEIQISFQVTDGQVYYVDYIYITIDENTDVFQSTYASVNTAVDERSLQISSSWGGYFISNYMTEWSRSDEECYYTDGIYTGTLTGMTANAIMRFLYKSSIIYNGDMNVRGAHWTLDQIYTIDSLNGKYMPIQASYNTERCEVSLIAIECRNDDVLLTEKHFGSNDNTLSN